MITIQGFARLCGCNTQTLRYYDRIGLLPPARVDEWTGYRYYEEDQALLFVKIKNLQQADFSIEEIRPLLNADDDRLTEALERKISEQEQKLERIRKIQKSYLKETMEMREMVCELTSFVEGRMDNPLLWKEFGMDGAQETEINAEVHDQLVSWLKEIRNAAVEIAQSMDGTDVSTMQEILGKLNSGNPEDTKNMILSVVKEEEAENGIPPEAEKVFERDGWMHVSEWIGSLPALNDGKKNYFLFRVREDSAVIDPGFSTLMLSVMDVRYDAMKGGMYCNVLRSDDSLNHFALFRK